MVIILQESYKCPFGSTYVYLDDIYCMITKDRGYVNNKGVLQGASVRVIKQITLVYHEGGSVFMINKISTYYEIVMVVVIAMTVSEK